MRPRCRAVNWGLLFVTAVAPRGLVLARQCPGSPGTCNPEDTGLPRLPVSWSPTLFCGSGPVVLPPVPWTRKKNNWKVAIFPPTRRSLLLRRPGCMDNFLNFFLSGLPVCIKFLKRAKSRRKFLSQRRHTAATLQSATSERNSGGFWVLLWETCGIQKQAVWTKCWVSFVTAVLLSCCINCTSICYPNFHGQYNCPTLFCRSSIFHLDCATAGT